VLDIKYSAAAAIPEHAEAILHKRLNYCTSVQLCDVSPTCADTIGSIPLWTVRDFSIRFGIRSGLGSLKRL
jgi:hypothetical protein